MTQQLQQIIDAAWENRASISPKAAPKEVADAVEHVIAELNNGKLRVATREGVGQWTVHQWIKKAVLLSFRLNDNRLMGDKDLTFFDKVPTKFAGMSEAELRAAGVRVVPPAVARRGSFQAKNVVLMPSYVNIGAYVDEGAMVEAFKNGEIDYARNVTSDQFEALKTEPDVVAVESALAAEANAFTMLNFNTYSKPIPDGGASTLAVQDPAFRDALGFAIDKDALVERVLGGHGLPGSTIIPPGPKKNPSPSRSLQPRR